MHSPFLSLSNFEESVSHNVIQFFALSPLPTVMLYLLNFLALRSMMVSLPGSQINLGMHDEQNVEEDVET